MPSALGLLKRGLNRPEKIPRYLFGLLVPSDRWGPEWHERDGVVLFEPGGYASSPRHRPEFASNLYHEVSGLRSILDEHLEGRPARSLEVGCGYGRLSPWIAAWTDDHVGIDPDEDAVAVATEQYAALGLAFTVGRAEALAHPDDEFGLVVTWTVLQHVDESGIEDAAAEIQRVLAPGGLLVCCERVRPPADAHIWPRSLETYDELLDRLAYCDEYDRPVEPTWTDSMGSTRPPERVLVFRK